VAEIATAFPGLFGYFDLLNLDLRDFAWWERKARVEIARKRLDGMGLMRLAMHGDESYDRQARNLADQIELWERPKWTDAEVIANWNARMEEIKRALKKVKEGSKQKK